MIYYKPKDSKKLSQVDIDHIKWAENQVVFRKMNGELRKFIEEIEDIPPVRGIKSDEFNKHDTYHFMCECSDENCERRILISFDSYEKAHERNDTFILTPGHELTVIEKIIARSPKYWTVQKRNTPRQSVMKLHKTSVNNQSI